MNNKIQSFLNQVTIVDTETTGIETDSSEIVEIASGTYINNNWSVDEQLLGTVKPIPPEASAIHFISNRMVRGLPNFSQQLDRVAEILNLGKTSYFVAHNADFDRQMIVRAYEKSFESNDQVSFIKNKNNWICTWRLAKAVLGIDYERQQYGLSYLRYSLNLDVPDDLPAHRAAADVLTCCKLLEKLIDLAYENHFIRDNDDIGEKLVSLCWNPVQVNTWPLGKHKGKKLDDIPTDYYVWALDNLDLFNESSANYNMDLADSVANVLENRL